MCGSLPGQTSPWHSVPSDVLWIQLLGEVEFTAAGELWPLRPLDILVIPANVPYIYTNVTFTEALFFDVFHKRPTGQKNLYWESDPGWPIREDAPLLDTDY
jgi:quercetin dioxygenase-like cupin family protein